MVSATEWADTVKPEWSARDADKAVVSSLPHLHSMRTDEGHRESGWPDKTVVIDRRRGRAGESSRFYYTHYESVIEARATEEAEALVEMELGALTATEAPR